MYIRFARLAAPTGCTCLVYVGQRLAGLCEPIVAPPFLSFGCGGDGPGRSPVRLRRRRGTPRAFLRGGCSAADASPGGHEHGHGQSRRLIPAADVQGFGPAASVAGSSDFGRNFFRRRSSCRGAHQRYPRWLRGARAPVGAAAGLTGLEITADVREKVGYDFPCRPVHPCGTAWCAHTCPQGNRRVEGDGPLQATEGRGSGDEVRGDGAARAVRCVASLPRNGGGLGSEAVVVKARSGEGTDSPQFCSAPASGVCCWSASEPGACWSDSYWEVPSIGCR